MLILVLFCAFIHNFIIESPFPIAMGFPPPVEAGGLRGALGRGWGRKMRKHDDLSDKPYTISSLSELRKLPMFLGLNERYCGLSRLAEDQVQRRHRHQERPDHGAR